MDYYMDTSIFSMKTVSLSLHKKAKVDQGKPQEEPVQNTSRNHKATPSFNLNRCMAKSQNKDNLLLARVYIY